MKTTKFTGTLLSLTASVLFMASNTFACSCPKSSPQDYFQKAAAVFMGKVIQTDGRDITFEVEKSWKLVTTDQIIVRDIGEGSCEWGFKVGEKYLMYASKHNDILTTHMCGGTEMFGLAGEQLAFLQGKSTIPLIEKPKVNNAGVSRNYFKEILIACAIVMLFLGIGFFVRKRAA
jgi:hypothetical protein